jgi:hypothetical protein
MKNFYHCIPIGLTTIACVSVALEPTMAAVFTGSEKNLALLAEAAISTHAMLTDTIGLSIDKLTFSGSFNDSGWLLNMNSNSPGLPINLSFTGTLNPSDNAGAFNSTGSIGTSTWGSSGNYTFTDNNPSSLSLDWNSVAQIVGGSIVFPFPFDFNVEKFYNLPGPDNTVQDIGQVTFTIAGIPIKTNVTQDSIHRKRPGDPERCSLTTTIEGISTLTASANNCDGGSVIGNVMSVSVPEPSSTLGLLALGTLGAASTLKRKLKPSKPSEKETTKVS